MRKKIFLNLILVIFLCVAQQGFSQGFVNLDFEDATIAPTPVGGLTYPANPTQAFPGWTVGAGAVVGYNNLSIGAPAVNLMGPNFPNAVNYTPLQGSYSVLLQYFGEPEPPTLSQTGLIPAGTQSISFLVGNGQSDTAVTLNGVNIPLVQISGGRLAGDISAFAGSSAQLTFSTLTGGQGGDWLYLDDIQFFPSSVPEPSALALGVLGATLLGFCRRNFV